MDGKRLSIKQNMLWSAFGSFIYLFSQWALTVLIVRMIGFGEAGLFSLAMSVTNVFYCIAIYGIRNYQVSDSFIKYTNYQYIIARVITCALSCLAFIIFIVINRYSLYVSLVLGSYMVFKLSEALVDVFHGVDQRCWRMDIIGKSFIIRAIFTFVTFTAILYITRQLLVAIIGMAFTAHIVILLYDIPKANRLERLSGVKEPGKVKEMLIECLPLMIYLVISATIGTIPRFFLEKFHGNEILGIYGSIATPTIIVQVAATYIFNPFITLFSEYYVQKNKKSFYILFFKCLGLISILSVVAIVCAALLGNFMLSLLFGDKILAYAGLLIPIVWCTILTAFIWFLSAILTVIRDFKGLMISNFVSLFLCAGLSIWLIPGLVSDGVNLALIISLLIQSVILVISGKLKTKKYFGEI